MADFEWLLMSDLNARVMNLFGAATVVLWLNVFFWLTFVRL